MPLFDWKPEEFSDKEVEFIKKCFKYRNNFIHCTVNIYTEELKNKFVELYLLYCKGYKFFKGNEIVFESKKLNNINSELCLFLDSFVIFRGEEVPKEYIEEYRKEIKKWENKSYFITSKGDHVTRIAFGDEKNYLPIEFASMYDYEYCDECGTKKGKYHLPLCDMEICPVCKKQKLSCSCDLKLEGFEDSIPKC